MGSEIALAEGALIIKPNKGQSIARQSSDSSGKYRSFNSSYEPKELPSMYVYVIRQIKM
jgi:hypothetical protein